MHPTSFLSRRQMLQLSVLGGAGFLSACTTTRGGGTSTATIDVDTIVTDSQAILSAISAALLAPTVIALLGPNYAAAAAALAAAQLVLVEIRTLTGGTVTVSVDVVKVQSLVVSLLADSQTALVLLQGVMGKLPGSEATTTGNVVGAALVLIPIVQLAAGLAAGPAVAGSMTEAEALAVVRRVRR